MVSMAQLGRGLKSPYQPYSPAAMGLALSESLLNCTWNDTAKALIWWLL